MRKSHGILMETNRDGVENEEMSEQVEDDVEQTSTDTETKESDVSKRRAPIFHQTRKRRTSRMNPAKR